MYQRKSRRCCALMLTVSICLRLCLMLGLDARAAACVAHAAKSREFVKWMLFLQTGQAPEIEEPQPEQHLWVLEIEEPLPEPIPVTRPEPPILPAVSADSIPVGGGCTYSFDKAALLDRPTAMDFSGEGPQILIVHTHGSEAYTPEPGLEYTAEGSYRTLDPTRSVIQVGAVLAQTLREQGVSVIHDTQVNDYPSYNDSYWNTLQRIDHWKSQYPGLQMVIDIHRDAVEDAGGNAVALSAQSDGESCARLMLVVGTDQGGLSHPNWQENLANALKLQAVLEGSHPGLCRTLDLRTERFNQHASPGSILVEVGTNGNTLTQALRSAELLGETLAALLKTLEYTGGTLP